MDTRADMRLPIGTLTAERRVEQRMVRLVAVAAVIEQLAVAAATVANMFAAAASKAVFVVRQCRNQYRQPLVVQRH